MDDKGPTMAALYAMAALRDSGLPLKRRIRILFGTNEETGSNDMKYYKSHGGELPVMGFTPDGEYPVINGEKGIINVNYEEDYPDRRCPSHKDFRRIRAECSPGLRQSRDHLPGRYEAAAHGPRRRM